MNQRLIEWVSTRRCHSYTPRHMNRLLIAAILLVPLAAACGGGSSGGTDTKTGSNAAGTAAMNASFTEEIKKIQLCVQGQVDAKADCTINFLQDPVTRMCSDVSTGRPNQFVGADYKKFTPTCDSWATVLGQTAPEKLTTLAKMLTDLEAAK